VLGVSFCVCVLEGFNVVMALTKSNETASSKRSST
jgi:hypothetical protein